MTKCPSLFGIVPSNPLLPKSLRKVRTMPRDKPLVDWILPVQILPCQLRRGSNRRICIFSCIYRIFWPLHDTVVRMIVLFHKWYFPYLKTKCNSNSYNSKNMHIWPQNAFRRSQVFVYNLRKQTWSSQSHFGLTNNMGSNMHMCKVITIWIGNWEKKEWNSNKGDFTLKWQHSHYRY